MLRFDCTAKESPLLGPHLLEASAGTGKTFSIEHIFVRLLLEADLELEQILAVTFTRAATRELKARIRSNLEKALLFPSWDYLQPFASSLAAKRRLKGAKALFDRCQIFTIHSFCHRMLKEYAFEAEIGFYLPDPNQQRRVSRHLLKEACHFLEEEKMQLFPEQILPLLNRYDSVEEFAKALLRESPSQQEVPSSPLQRFSEAIRHWEGPIFQEKELLADFQVLKKGYRVKQGNFERQIRALARAFAHPEDPESFRSLLLDRGSLFSLLAPSNQKVKKEKELPPSFPFFEQAMQIFAPLIEEALDQKAIFRSLSSAWRIRAEELLSEEELLTNPDEILYQMKRALNREAFVSRIRKRYAAAIIDEFQDTDPLQWEIFQRLFVKREEPIKALYLVGDPKQSIYRFRRADVYTYLKARDLLGEEALYFLDTNFRSSKAMIGALNALFTRSWFHLPKTKREIAYIPVQAGARVEVSFNDEKGALHALVVSEEKESFERFFLPLAVQEIERLLPVVSPKAFALLVKDRYQAQKALTLFKERGIAAVAKSHTPLGKTVAFQALKELFETLSGDPTSYRIVQAGPFASLPLPSREDLSRGLKSFFRSLLERGAFLYVDPSDLKQVIEELLLWEQKEGLSIEGLLSFLKEFEKLKSDEGGARQIETDEDAVQILTLHISKGLEFDIVFALGLAAAQPEEGEEREDLDAEKLRQLYVAMTRAKKRLYLPVALSPSKKGRASPMELFCRILQEQEGDLLNYFHILSTQESFTFEELHTPLQLAPPILPEQKEEAPSSFSCAPSVQSSFLYSFTALARKGSLQKIPETGATGFSLHTLPKGSETGVILHEIFEKLFISPQPLWQERETVASLVSKELSLSPLLPWREAIEEGVWNTLSLSLLNSSFSLKDLEVGEVQAEMEFLFLLPPHAVKGFIDLVFCWKGLYYLLDWKTNWLGENDEAYNDSSIKEAMDLHDYWLQAALYAEGLCRYLEERAFGGAIYLFLRGNRALHFQPDRNLLKERHELF